MAKRKVFWRAVNRVLDNSNIILEVLDARFIDDTRHKEIEDKIRQRRKVLIFVINKFTDSCCLAIIQYCNRQVVSRFQQMC